IIGFSELLLDSRLEEQQYRHTQTVHKAARSLLKLLNDILDTAKLDRGAIELELLDFDLEQLCADVVNILSLQASNKDIALTLDYRASRRWYKGDALRLRQVLLNLLSNAVKFTEQGSVQLIVDDSSDGVKIDVIDTGIGIDAERLPHIFSPFSQADASMSRRFGGTGLGTTIAQQLTQLMQGELRAESTPGKGSTFTVCLPLAPGTAHAPVNKTPMRHDSKSLRFLAVDDVVENLELLKIVLQRDGHHVDGADSGEDAVALYRANAYDIVLMDVQMPGMDGLQATRLIRRHERDNDMPATPVIALTASVMDRDRAAARDAGMDGFATKPLDWQEFYREVARLATGYLHPEKHAQDTRATTADADAGTIIDWAAAIHRWGDESALMRALRTFYRECDATMLPALATALRDGKPGTTAATAHKLRGAAANLGLSAIADHAAQIEVDAGADAMPDLSALRAAVTAFRQWLDQQSAPAETVANDSATAAQASFIQASFIQTPAIQAPVDHTAIPRL
ncbi:MAG: ATP-binding protein, partial [Pseudohongiella sp.]